MVGCCDLKHVEPKYTILHFHGSGQFIFTQYRYMEPLVEQGFQVFVFDYSGYGFSGGKASRANVLNDGRAALDYLMTKEEVKATKLVLYGQSLGRLSGGTYWNRKTGMV